MSARDDLDRRLASWMTEIGSASAPAGRFDQAMDATARQRPRPRWLAPFGSDWVGTTIPRRVELAWPGRRELVLVVIVATLVAAAIAGAILVGGSIQHRDPLRWRLGGLAYSVDGDIYVASADGTSPVRIADGTPDGAGSTPFYWDPHWSPDGRYLMYQDSSSIAQTVYVVDPQGNPVASFPGWYSRWAPDSSRIATWEQAAVDRVDVRALDGRLLTTVVVPADMAGAGDQPAGWSADGTSIVMWRSGMAFPVDGSAPRRDSAPVPPGGPYRNPLWSPGSDRIAVTVFNGPESILVVNVTTTTATTIYTPSAGNQVVAAVAWSPDGQAVLVVQGNGSPGGASIWSVAADGSGGHVLVERADQEGADWRWVPEGSH